MNTIFSEYEDILTIYNNFNHAYVDVVKIDPRQEITLTLRVLLWEGSQGHYADPTVVRFGGISDFETVKSLFSDIASCELGQLRLSRTKASKHGQLQIEFIIQALL